MKFFVAFCVILGILVLFNIINELPPNAFDTVKFNNNEIISSKYTVIAQDTRQGPVGDLLINFDNGDQIIYQIVPVDTWREFKNSDEPFEFYRVYIHKVYGQMVK